jgi:hypothetical protein
MINQLLGEAMLVRSPNELESILHQITVVMTAEWLPVPELGIHRVYDLIHQTPRMQSCRFAVNALKAESQRMRNLMSRDVCVARDMLQLAKLALIRIGCHKSRSSVHPLQAPQNTLLDAASNRDIVDFLHTLEQMDGLDNVLTDERTGLNRFISELDLMMKRAKACGVRSRHRPNRHADFVLRYAIARRTGFSNLEHRLVTSKSPCAVRIAACVSARRGSAVATAWCHACGWTEGVIMCRSRLEGAAMLRTLSESGIDSATGLYTRSLIDATLRGYGRGDIGCALALLDALRAEPMPQSPSMIHLLIWLRDAGSAIAHYELSTLTSHPEEQARYLRSASNLGMHRATHDLAMICWDRFDPSACRILLEYAASDNDLESIMACAMGCLCGKHGYDRDITTALQWAAMGASLNHGPAIRLLAALDHRAK